MAKVSSEHTFFLPEEKIEKCQTFSKSEAFLHTLLCSFPKLRTRRICSAIKVSFSSGSFSLFSWPWCVRGRGYCKEKLDADHSYLRVTRSQRNVRQFARTISPQFQDNSLLMWKHRNYCRKHGFRHKAIISENCLRGELSGYRSES